MKEVKIYFDGITERGSVIKDAMVILREDYTSNQLVNEIKEGGFQYFMLPSMRRFVKI